MSAKDIKIMLLQRDIRQLLKELDDIKKLFGMEGMTLMSIKKKVNGDQINERLFTN